MYGCMDEENAIRALLGLLRSNSPRRSESYPNLRTGAGLGGGWRRRLELQLGPVDMPRSEQGVAPEWGVARKKAGTPPPFLAENSLGEA